ncbi:MAG: UPF0280 family protein, partial [Promethearchaeota archaeon]
FMLENGGELRIHSKEKETIVGLYSDNERFGSKFGFLITPDDKNMHAIGTSSATFGRGLSFGDADIVTVFSNKAALADAAATSICNATTGENDADAIKKGLEQARHVKGITGVFIVKRDHVGTWGKVPKMINIKQKSELDSELDFSFQ